MIFEHNGNKYRIMFRYGPKDEEHRKLTAMVERRETLTTPDGVTEKWVTLVSGTARCNPIDRFKREDGRIISLRKATEKLDCGGKRATWNAYTNRRKAVRK